MVQKMVKIRFSIWIYQCIKILSEIYVRMQAVQLLSWVQLFATPQTAARQDSLSFTIS